MVQSLWGSNNGPSKSQANSAPPIIAEAGNISAAVTSIRNSEKPFSRRYAKTVNQYANRSVTYYQFSISDLRMLGTTQFASTLFASIGSFGLSMYFDYGRDIENLASNQAKVPDGLISGQTVWSWITVASFIIAAVCFVIRRVELSRIIAEHEGEITFWTTATHIWKRFLGSLWRS